jgi:hypothetical protein
MYTEKSIILDATMFTTDSRASDSKATEFEMRNDINFILKTSRPPKTAITPTVIFFTIPQNMVKNDLLLKIYYDKTVMAGKGFV